MTQKVIGSLGLTENDFTHLASLCAERGLTLHKGNSISQYKALSIVIFGFEDGDISKLQKAYTDYPNIQYIPCIDFSNTEALFTISTLRLSAILPTKCTPTMLRKALSKADDSIERIIAAQNLSRGIHAYSMKLQFESKDVRIAKIAQFVASECTMLGANILGTEEDSMALSLEEALANSLEHGNLELSSSLRPESLLDEDLYEEEKQKRLSDSVYGKRPLIVSINATNKIVEIEILDSGKGFHIDKIKEVTEENVNEVSGKGFELIARSFDNAEYKANGTVLALKKARNYV